MSEQIIPRKQTGWELVWENSSPQSNFDAQTISIDLSQYNLVMVLAHADTGATMISPIILTKDSSGLLIYEFMNVNSGASSILFRRIITGVTDTGVEFNVGQAKPVNTTAAATTNNAVCIPYRIYAQ